VGGWKSSVRTLLAFIGNMTAGPPSIDNTAGGGDPSGHQVCGYFQSTAAGACYRKIGGVTTCQAINAGNADNADPQTSSSRNVWEWPTDWYRPGHHFAEGEADPQGPANVSATVGGQVRVIKGGSWLCAPNFCARYRPAARQPQEADLGATHIGFRTFLRTTRN
jgi:hypothetical protein